MPEFKATVRKQRRVTFPMDVKEGDLVEITYYKLNEKGEIIRDQKFGAGKPEVSTKKWQECYVCGEPVDTHVVTSMFRLIGNVRRYRHGFCKPD